MKHYILDDDGLTLVVIGPFDSKADADSHVLFLCGRDGDKPENSENYGFRRIVDQERLDVLLAAWAESDWAPDFTTPADDLALDLAKILPPG